MNSTVRWLAVVLVGCGPVVPLPDAGPPGPMTPVDGGTLGPMLACRATVVGAASNAFSCDATATFARGAPNATTIVIRGNATTRDPELDFTIRLPLEPEPGRLYGWADAVSAELQLNDVPRGNTFVASRALQVDPFSFSVRVQEVTGRVATANGGAQLRVTYQLEATLVPGPGSTATNNARVTVMVTR